MNHPILDTPVSILNMFSLQHADLIYATEELRRKLDSMIGRLNGSPAIGIPQAIYVQHVGAYIAAMALVNANPNLIGHHYSRKHIMQSIEFYLDFSNISLFSRQSPN